MDVVALFNPLTQYLATPSAVLDSQKLCDQRLPMRPRWLCQVLCDMTMKSYQTTFLCIIEC